MRAERMLHRGRLLAADLMQDTCQIWTGETTSVLNEETLEYDIVPTYSYEGPCRLTFANAAVQDVDPGGQLLVSQRATLSLPISGSGTVAKNHIATILTSEHDASLAGKRFHVEGPHHQTQATARRFPVKEVS